MHEALRTLSCTDGLTGLLNRRAFAEEVGRRHRHALRTGRPAALLYIDLDHFKGINDARGHQQGDAVLKGVGGLLAGATRASDVVGRLGGDEFAIWLEETGLAGARAKAAALVAAAATLSQPSPSTGAALGFSIGVAVFDPAGNEALDALIGRADGAMYQAKRAGKGRFVVAPMGEQHSNDDEGGS